MKRMKKTIALIIAFLIAVSSFAVSSFAVATELEAGNSMSSAVEIPQYDVNYVSSLSSTQEQDWFKFTTESEDAYYKIEMINYSLPEGLHYYQNALLFLCDKNGKEIGSFYGSYGDGSLSLKLENNTTYYIRVTHERISEKGNYEITLSVNYDEAPNDMEKAITTQLDKLVVSEMDGTADVDWFKFTAPVSGEYTLTVNNCDITTDSNSESRCMIVYLYDKWSQTLSSDFTQYDSNAELTATLEKGETYYVKVYMGLSATGTTGQYTFIIDSPVEASVNLEKIAVQTLPSKTTYYVGESFDKNGLTVKATYSNGTTAIISNYVLSGFNSSSSGSKVITVSYTENGITKTASFTVSVIVEEQEEPDPEPGNEDDNLGEEGENDGGFLDTIANIFMSILDFFIGIIEVLTNLLS